MNCARRPYALRTPVSTTVRCKDEMVFDELFGFLEEVLALQKVFPIDDLFELISTARVGEWVVVIEGRRTARHSVRIGAESNFG